MSIGRMAGGLVTGIDTLNRWVGSACAWLVVLLVVITTADVLLRYLFSVSFIALHELEWHLFAVVFLLPAGFALLRDAHVRVDIVYQRLGPRARRWINIAGILMFLLPTCYLVIATAMPLVARSWALGEGSGSPMGLPARYALKAMIPLGFFLLGLQGVAELLKLVLGRPGPGDARAPEPGAE